MKARFMDPREHKTEALAKRIVRISGWPLLQLGDVVDVGCGTGMVLAAAEPYSRTLTGVDMDPEYVAIASSRVPQAKVRVGFAGDDLGSDAFDTAFFCDVIEHVESPVAALASIRKALRPGGLLVITTPNANSVVRLVEGRSWFGFAETHLILFTPLTLKHLAVQSGFVGVKVTTIASNRIVGTVLEPWGSAAAILVLARKPHPTGAA